MSKFNVETPQEWKNNLYAKISSNEERKLLHFKPVMAAISVILVFALTTTAFAFTAMPEFFRGLFQGSDEYLDPHYMSKSIMFDSDTDDFEVVCTGIMGDKNYLALSIMVKSKCSTNFIFDNHYVFETMSFRFVDEKPSNDNGYSSTFNLYYSDDKTLIGDLFVSGNSGNGFTGKDLRVEFKNLESLTLEDDAVFERVINCNFESEIAIDYADTSEKMHAVKSEIPYRNIVLSPVNAEISNISLNAEFEIIKGNGKEIDEAYPFEKLTVVFKDGTVSEFNFYEENEKQNIFYVKSVTKTEDAYVLSGIFGKAVDASDVLSIKLDETEVFVK